MIALEDAIELRLENRVPNAHLAHERIAFMYNWREVTARTEVVYDRAIREPPITNMDRIERYLRIGWIVGPLFVLLFALGKIIISVCSFLRPQEVSSTVF